MYGEIESLVRRFEAGRITRRELIAGLLPLVAATAARSSGCAAQAATQAPAPIEVSGLDHIALRVADPVRSAKFYTEHLGATPRAQSANSVFLNVGRNWIALFGPGAVSSGFPPTSSGMDHFAFHSVKQRSLEERMGVLRAHNLNPVSPAGSERVYFRDPDGIILQLS
jgi:catechol 2,3-dioxygenase-like lactoylglutathione lyase family enzyme